MECSIFIGAVLAPASAIVFAPKVALTCTVWLNAWIIEIYYAVKQGCIDMHLAGHIYSLGK